MNNFNNGQMNQQDWNNTQMQQNYQNPYGSMNQIQDQFGMQNQQATTGPRFNPPTQQGQQNQPITYIQGRVINSVDEVKPEEVPMNGEWVFFPVANGREIYAMSWSLRNGILTNRYVLGEDPKAQSPKENENFNLIMGRLDEMHEQIQKLVSNNYQKKPYNNRPKQENKEVNENA